MPPGDEGSTRTAYRIADEAADHLEGDRPGLLLVGPDARTALVTRDLLDRLDRSAFACTTFDAIDGTPAGLRDTVAACHRRRASPATLMLLVVTHARRLSHPVLLELDQAAEAAASLGGLKLVLVSDEDPIPGIRQGGFIDLAACVATRLTVPLPPPGIPPRAPSSAPPAAPILGRPTASPGNPLKRVLVASAILAVLAVGIVMAIAASRPGPAPVPPAIQAPPAIVQPAPPAPVPPPPEPTRPPAPAPVEPPPPPAAKPSDTSLLLIAGPADTLPALYERVYRDATPPPYDQIQALNPVIRPGIRLIFPPPPAGWPTH